MKLGVLLIAIATLGMPRPVSLISSKLLAIKQHSNYASEEAYSVNRTDNNVSILNGTRYESVNDQAKSASTCIEPGNYFVHMIDRYGDGWGSSGAPSFVNVYVDKVPVHNTYLNYGSGNREGQTYFSTVFEKPYNTEWKYTDVPQTGIAWTSSSFDASSWSTANGGSIPPHTATTRYYRAQVSYTGETSTLNTIGVSLVLDSAFIIYADGEETIRYDLPSEGVTATTPATSVRRTNPEELTRGITLNNVYLDKDTHILTLAIEVHMHAGDETVDDVFNGGVHFIQHPNNEDTRSKLTGGTMTCYPTGSNCAKLISPYKSSYYYTSSSTTPYFIYNLGNNYEYVNTYTVTTASTTSYGYPKSFSLFGSQDGTNWDLLDSQTGIAWSSSQIKTFRILSNKKSYSQFKFKFDESSKTTNSGLANFSVNTLTTVYVGDGLVYPQESYSTSVMDDSFTITPISTGFHDFTSTPPMTSGLSINSSTGVITVAPTSSLSATYTISALNNLGATKTFQITFTVTGCDQPEKSLISLVKTNKSSYTYESFIMYDSNDNQVFASAPYTTSSTITNKVCVDTGTYKFVLKQSQGKGWYAASKLTVNLLYAGVTMPLAEMAVKSGYELTAYVSTKVPLLSQSSNWKYGVGVIPTNWASATYAGEQLAPFSFTSSVPSNHKLWLFHTTFNLDSKTGYHGFAINTKLKDGYIAVINGHELYRKWIPEGEVTLNTEATSTSTTADFNTVTGPMDFLNVGSNKLTILILHKNSDTPTVVDFDCFVNLLGDAASQFGRYWGATNAGTGGTRSYLFNYDWYYDYSYNPGYLKPLYVTLTYGAKRAEFVNKYCITSSKVTYNLDPSDWGVYGQTGNGVWELLNNVTNAYFSDRRATRCFYMASNTKAYAAYKIDITENAYHPSGSTYGYYMGDLSYVIEDTSSLIVPPLSVTPPILRSYVGVPFADSTPSSAIYYNFRISPPLELPLELDTSTGSIRGIPDKTMSITTYTLTATNHLGQDSTTTVTVSVDYCMPPNVLVDFAVTSDYYGEQIGFELRDSSNTLILQRAGVARSMTSHYPQCITADRYNLTLTDTGGNGWSYGYMQVTLENGDIIFRGSLGPSQSAESFPLSVGYVLPPLRTTWDYHNSNSQVQADWKTNTGTISWPSALPDVLPAPTSTTQYYRSTFTIQDISYYASCEVSVRTSGGFIAYLNGQEIHRSNLPEGEIDASTPALEYYDASVSIANTVPVQFGPLVSGINVLAIEVHHKNYQNVTTAEFDAAFSLVGNGSLRLNDLTVEANESSTDSLIDNTIYTTYVSGTCVGQVMKFIYNNNRREYISSYSLTTGSQCNVRSPTAWTFSASNDLVNWDILHTVNNVEYTQYYQVLKYDIFSRKSYNAFKIEIQACEAMALDGYEDDYTCMTYNEGTSAGFALSSVGLYSTVIENACSAQNGYAGAVNGTYAYKNCPDYYFGRVYARCINGSFLPDESECEVYAPTKVHYSTSPLQVVSGKYFEMKGQVEAAEFTCKSEPALPAGVSINPTTGDIYGTTTTVFDYLSFHITCSNSAGSTTTTIFLSSAEPESIDFIMLALIIVLVALIIAIVVVIVTNLTKGKNTAKNSRSSTASRRGSTNAKVLKV